MIGNSDAVCVPIRDRFYRLRLPKGAKGMDKVFQQIHSPPKPHHADAGLMQTFIKTPIQNPLFHDFTTAEWDWLAKNIHFTSLEEGEQLICKDQEASFFAIVLTGMFEQRVSSSMSFDIGRAELLGEQPYIENRVRLADYYCSQSGSIAVITYSTLDTLFRTKPAINFVLSPSHPSSRGTIEQLPASTVPKLSTPGEEKESDSSKGAEAKCLVLVSPPLYLHAKLLQALSTSAVTKIRNEQMTMQMLYDENVNEVETPKGTDKLGPLISIPSSSPAPHLRKRRGTKIGGLDIMNMRKDLREQELKLEEATELYEEERLAKEHLQEKYKLLHMERQGQVWKLEKKIRALKEAAASQARDQARVLHWKAKAKEAQQKWDDELAVVAEHMRRKEFQIKHQKSIAAGYERLLKHLSVSMFVKSFRIKKSIRQLHLRVSGTLIDIIKDGLDDSERSSSDPVQKNLLLRRRAKELVSALSSKDTLDQTVQIMSEDVARLEAPFQKARELIKHWKATADGFFQRNTQLSRELIDSANEIRRLSLKVATLESRLNLKQQSTEDIQRAYDARINIARCFKHGKKGNGNDGAKMLEGPQTKNRQGSRRIALKATESKVAAAMNRINSRRSIIGFEDEEPAIDDFYKELDKAKARQAKLAEDGSLSSQLKEPSVHTFQRLTEQQNSLIQDKELEITLLNERLEYLKAQENTLSQSNLPELVAPGSRRRSTVDQNSSSPAAVSSTTSKEENQFSTASFKTISSSTSKAVASPYTPEALILSLEGRAEMARAVANGEKIYDLNTGSVLPSESLSTQESSQHPTSICSNPKSDGSEERRPSIDDSEQAKETVQESKISGPEMLDHVGYWALKGTNQDSSSSNSGHLDKDTQNDNEKSEISSNDLDTLSSSNDNSAASEVSGSAMQQSADRPNTSPFRSRSETARLMKMGGGDTRINMYLPTSGSRSARATPIPPSSSQSERPYRSWRQIHTSRRQRSGYGKRNFVKRLTPDPITKYFASHHSNRNNHRSSRSRLLTQSSHRSDLNDFDFAHDMYGSTDLAKDITIQAPKPDIYQELSPYTRSRPGTRGAASLPNSRGRSGRPDTRLNHFPFHPDSPRSWEVGAWDNRLRTDHPVASHASSSVRSRPSTRHSRGGQPNASARGEYFSHGGRKVASQRGGIFSDKGWQIAAPQPGATYVHVNPFEIAGHHDLDE